MKLLNLLPQSVRVRVYVRWYRFQKWRERVHDFMDCESFTFAETWDSDDRYFADCIRRMGRTPIFALRNKLWVWFKREIRFTLGDPALLGCTLITGAISLFIWSLIILSFLQ